MENALLSVRKKKKKWGRIVFLCVMMLIPVLEGIVWDVYLKVSTVKLMFTNATGTGPGVYWIKWAFSEMITAGSQSLYAIRNYVIIVLVFNFICLPIQCMISYFFFRGVPFTKALRILCYMPCLFSVTVTCLVFGMMLDNTMGPVTEILRRIGVSIPNEGLMYSPKTAMPWMFVYFVWATFGSPTIMMTAAMLRLPQDVIESARLDTNSMWIECWRIVLPMVSPILSVMLLSNITTGFGIYGQIVMLTDPTQSKLYTVSYVITESVRAGRYQEAAGRGFIFTLIAIPIIVGSRQLLLKIFPDVSY